MTKCKICGGPITQEDMRQHRTLKSKAGMGRVHRRCLPDDHPRLTFGDVVKK